jgi:methylase of polypeptide subunit release factors
MKLLLMRVNELVRKCLFCRQGFIRWVFGIRMVALPTVHSYCEWGTILQRLILARYVRQGDRVLDLGTGAHAIMAVFVAKRFPNIHVVATDILPERVLLAQQTAAANQTHVVCMASDLFEGVAGSFDLVLFNPPAIPSRELADLGFSLKTVPGLGSRRCWSGDGGDDGLREIRRFLMTVESYLTERGRAILCVNPAHCGRKKIKQFCRMAGLKVQRIHTILSFTNAYVISRDTPGNDRNRREAMGSIQALT